MSIKKLFDNNRQAVTVAKYLKLSSPDSLGDGIESGQDLKQLVQRRNYFLPDIDYGNPHKFVKYGSAELYYQNAFEYIANYYPYDGSSYEKVKFYNEISPLEKYIFDEVYPTATGFVTLGIGSSTVVSNPTGYGSITDPQYITLKGGPHLTTLYDEETNRTSNLEFAGTNGTTVEFFLHKSGSINPANESQKQVVFDLYNGQASGSATYGRLRIELESGSAGNTDRFYVTMRSGSSGFTRLPVPTTGGLTQIASGKWHHYSFVFNTSTKSPTIDFFVNGKCIQTAMTGASGPLDTPVTGTLIANIGALRTAPSGNTYHNTQMEGSGNLNGSLDEFRFWKKNRNDEEVGRYWFTQVNGGADKQEANVALGAYYKFNEGITLTSSIDRVVMDYSGRLSNGVFTNFRSSGTRQTGSAINLLKIPEVFETQTPIVRQSVPIYRTTRNRYLLSGSNYDYTNNSRLLNFMPNWIIEEDENNQQELKSFLQILGMYFDGLHNQIRGLKEVRFKNYQSGSSSEHIREFPHNDSLIESLGFEAPEFFANIGAMQQFLQRDEQINFEQRLESVKNTIYKNIYNNLIYFFKSKGNEKSITNFIRCLGVGDEIIALNTYPDNVDYELTSSYFSTTSNKKYIDFSGLVNQGDDKATVYQYYNANNPDSVGIINTLNDGNFAFTLQSEIVFPNKDNFSTLEYDLPTVISSSLFGYHTPLYATNTSTNLTWETVANDTGLQVYAVRSPGPYPEIYHPLERVKDAYFVVKDRNDNTLLTSSVFRNVYDNEKWNLSLSVRPKNYPFCDEITGSAASVVGYTLELAGANYRGGILQNEFQVSKNYSSTSGSAAVTGAKRVYLGAHRTNFTGSVIKRTDIRGSSVRYWTDYIPPETLKVQASEVNTYGRRDPYKNAYSYQSAKPQVFIPRIQTLALDWNFANITGSSSTGFFGVSDFSSGSLGGSYEGEYQGDRFSALNLRQHTGQGQFFGNLKKPARKEYVFQNKLQVPEYIGSNSMVKVLTSDDITFGKYIRPNAFFFAVEKSMYRSISQRMLDLFASIDEFNNLIGEPVNTYRMQYKRMEKIREIFFRKVENNIPDLDKYVRFYKWLDTAMTEMIEQMFPESSRHAPSVRKLVENHVLERPKIQYKLPILKKREPWYPKGPDFIVASGSICKTSPGWGLNHHPVSGRQNQNCFWWRTRSTPPSASAIRPTVLDLIRTDNRRNRIVCVASDFVPPIYGGINQNWNKKRRIRDFTFDSFQPLEDCKDPLGATEKVKVPFRVTKDKEYFSGDQLAPFTAVSASIKAGYNAFLNDSTGANLPGISLNNLHEDSVASYRYSVPMQGPYTDRWVGGIQARHVAPLRQQDRKEGFKLTILGGTGSLTTLTTENIPKGQYLRDLGPKAPVSIKNIKTITTNVNTANGVRVVGNYLKNYQPVQGVDRSATNVDFVFNNQNYPKIQIPSAFVRPPSRATAGLSGSVDYASPREKATVRNTEVIFAERFSAPGDKTTSKQQFRDVPSDTFAPNNALPFRNMLVRRPYQNKLKQHTRFGGYRENNVPALEKIQRNTVKLIELVNDGAPGAPTTRKTGSIFNNPYVTSPIPSADRSQWTSYISGSDNYRVYKEYISLRSRYPQDISFVTSSINSLFSAVTKGTFLNTANKREFLWAHNRDFVPWKQLRSGQTNQGRSFILNNTYELPPVEINGVSENGISAVKYDPSTYTRTVKDRNNNVSTYYYSGRFKEPPITSRYKQLIYQISTPTGTPAETNDSNTDLQIDTSYGNVLMGFASRNLNQYYKKSSKWYFDDIKRPYEIIRDLRTQQVPDSLDGLDLVKVFSYPEIIYPKEVYTYFSGSRARLAFIYPNWKSDKPVATINLSGALGAGFSSYTDLVDTNNIQNYNRLYPRLKGPYTTSQEYVVLKDNQEPYNSKTGATPAGNGIASIWPLDSYLYSESTGSLVQIQNASVPIVLADAGTMASGELMMTHYGSIDDQITGPPKTGIATYQRADTLSAQYLYNVPVTKRITRSVPASASMTAAESQKSLLHGTDFVIDTTVFVGGITFTFDESSAGPTRVAANDYTIGVLNVSAGDTGKVAIEIQSAIALCKQNAEIDVTATNTSGSSEVLITSDVGGTAMNGKTITGTAITAGYLTPNPPTFAGGLAAVTSNAPEPRSPGSVYTRPFWSAARGRRYVDGVDKGRYTSESNTYPFYNSYEDFVENARLIGKSYTITPEFRISEHVGEYIRIANPFGVVSSSIGLTGSSTNLFNGTNTGFYERYCQSDFVEFLGNFLPDRWSEDSQDANFQFNNFARHFKMGSRANLKLLPYDGFYPVRRSVQLANEFSKAYQRVSYIEGTSSIAPKRSLLRPLYAPGIFYNSIRSGVAVDYPVRRPTRNTTQFRKTSATDPLRGALSGTLSQTKAGRIPGSRRRSTENNNTTFDFTSQTIGADVNKFFWADRLPFETILNPPAHIGILDPNAPGADQEDFIINKMIINDDLNEYLLQDVTGSFKPGNDDSVYKKAVSNFLANVPQFFLKKKTNNNGYPGYLTKFVGRIKQTSNANLGGLVGNDDGANQVGIVQVSKGAVYAMEVGLLKTDQFNMYSNPYSFGIPTATGSLDWDTLLAEERPQNPAWPQHRAEFAPFTPPYYYGPSLVRIMFAPRGDKENYTLDEIINNTRGELFVQYLNDSGSYYDMTSGSYVDQQGNVVSSDGYSPEYGWNRAWQNRMDIDASISISNRFPISTGQYRSMDPNTWTIMPKWECPILDFPSHRSGKGSPPASYYEFSSSVAPSEYTQSTQGMWHQYGVTPQDNQGVYMYIKDVNRGEYDTVALPIENPGGPSLPSNRVYTQVEKLPRFVIENQIPVKSLAELCGFDPEEVMSDGFDISKAKRLGELADDGDKTLSEAVLALPYYLNSKNEPTFITVQAPASQLGPKIKEFRKHFTKFSLPPALAAHLLTMVPGGYPDIPDLITPFGDDEYDSVLEGLGDLGLKPLRSPVIYLLEHKVALTKQDLADVWQGIMPDLSRKINFSFASIDHYMPGDNVEDIPSQFPEVVRSQIELGVPRTGHPRYDLLDIASLHPSEGVFGEIKWMVFRVKQKGIGTYEQMIMNEVDGESAMSYDNPLLTVQRSEDPQQSRILRDRHSMLAYMLDHNLFDPTFNWPYDYCSLIEHSQLETTVGFRPDLKREMEQQYPDGIPNE